MWCCIHTHVFTDASTHAFPCTSGCITCPLCVYVHVCVGSLSLKRWICCFPGANALCGKTNQFCVECWRNQNFAVPPAIIIDERDPWYLGRVCARPLALGVCSCDTSEKILVDDVTNCAYTFLHACGRFCMFMCCVWVKIQVFACITTTMTKDVSFPCEMTADFMESSMFLCFFNEAHHMMCQVTILFAYDPAPWHT